MVIDKVERVKSQESRVSVFRLAQPVGRGNIQQKETTIQSMGNVLFVGNCLVKGVGIFLPLLRLGLGALVHDLVV